MKHLYLLSGLGTSGKDYWAQRILAWYKEERPELITAFVGISQARLKYWGKSAGMTDADHLLKNEITLTDVAVEFMAKNTDVVVLNMTMLTVLQHQVPFMAMLNKTRALLALKERELRHRFPGRTPEEAGIELRAMVFTCDFETTKRRIEARNRGENKSGGILDIAEFEKGRKAFELPALYEAITVDTSDESPSYEMARNVTIRNHIGFPT